MILALAACVQKPETIVLFGTVENARDGAGEAVPGAALLVLDAGTNEVGSGTSDDDGNFAVDVPAGTPFFLQVAADGYVPTAWTGTAGLVDLYAGDGVPWIAAEDWLQAVRDAHAACPSVNDAGAVVTGEVRQYIDGFDVDDMPVVPSATATVTGSDSEALATCYLDDEGVSDAEATNVGSTGGFAVFGVPEGPLLLDLAVDDTDVSATYQYIVQTDGLVVTFPALLEG